MNQRKVERLRRIVLRALLALLTILPTAGAQPANPPKPLQMSMAKTFLNDQPQILVDIFVGEFKEVMKQATGLNGDIGVTHNAAEIAAKLDAKELDFGIMHAHEFARLRGKYPELRPFLT